MKCYTNNNWLKKTYVTRFKRVNGKLLITYADGHERIEEDTEENVKFLLERMKNQVLENIKYHKDRDKMLANIKKEQALELAGISISMLTSLMTTEDNVLLSFACLCIALGLSVVYITDKQVKQVIFDEDCDYLKHAFYVEYQKLFDSIDYANDLYIYHELDMKTTGIIFGNLEAGYKPLDINTLDQIPLEDLVIIYRNYIKHNNLEGELNDKETAIIHI